MDTHASHTVDMATVEMAMANMNVVDNNQEEPHEPQVPQYVPRTNQRKPDNEIKISTVVQRRYYHKANERYYKDPEKYREKARKLYHTNPEYREKKLAGLKAYREKKRAEMNALKNNEEAA